MGNGSLSKEEGEKRLKIANERETTAWKALAADEKNIIAFLAPFLRLSH
jgi:hypothetical protein